MNYPNRHWPSEEVIARALVTACRCTGEDVLVVFGGAPRSHARHYALHALVAEFPEIPRKRVSHFLGCPGKATFYWKNSCMHVTSPGGVDPKSSWWSKERFAEVRLAVREALGAQKVALKVNTEPKELQSVAKAAPEKLAVRSSSEIGRSQRSVTVSDVGMGYARRKTLEDELRQAVLNTGGRVA
jgi:hypothetical protein